MSEEIKIPAHVLKLAEQAATERVPDPNPIAWKEYPDKWVVVFEDGRKLAFSKDVDPAKPMESAATAADAPAGEVKAKRKPRARV